MITISISLLLILLSSIGYFLSRQFQIKFILLINLLWSAFLIVNRLKLSGLQIDWTFNEQVLISFLIFLPSLLVILLLKISLVNNNSIKSHIDSNFMEPNSNEIKKSIFVLLMLSVSIFIIDFFIYGVPIFQLNAGTDALNNNRLAYRIPILFSWAYYAFLTCLIASCILFFKGILNLKIFILFLFMALLLTTLHFARGFFVTFFCVPLISYFLYSPSTPIIKILRTFLPLLLIFFLFSILGDLRQNLDESFNINDYGKFVIEIPSHLAWIYGYLFINFDNLILCIRDFEIRDAIGYKTIQNISPALIGTITGQEYDGESLFGIQTLPYIGRFNLPTSLGTFGYDFGWFGVYLYSLSSIMLVPIIFSKPIKELSITLKILLVYFSLAFVFITTTNYFFTSRFILFIFALIMFKSLLIIFTKKK